MNNNILLDCPIPLRDFLFYMETIKGRSPRTVEGYYIDLRTFLRYIKRVRNLVPPTLAFEEISIGDVDMSLIATIMLSDAYEFLHFTANERSNSGVTRSRKVSSLRGFFNYLTVKAHLLEQNPVRELEVPSFKKSIPKYLTLENSIELLASAEAETGESRLRDYCIITLLLNCGMRLSELVGINQTDIRNNQLRLLGKGNKERIIYLNDACLSAIEAYKAVRPKDTKEKNALFVSRNGTRISRRRVQQIVENQLTAIGLDHKGFSVHKLRHTAATLMYQYGHVDIRMLKEILGHVNVGTTEIYTHISSEQMEDAAKRSPLAKIKPRNK